MQKTFPAEFENAVGARATLRGSVRGSGYGTNTAKWTVELDDRRRVFVKHALDERAAEWLRDEVKIYEAVSAPFLPAFIAFHDAEETFLVIEDLSDAYWPPPWLDDQITIAIATLDEVHATRPARRTARTRRPAHLA